KSEMVPTRAELEFLRRENLELLSKIAAMQKQVDILSSARLVTSETQQLGVAPVAHRRVSQERDELRSENINLKVEIQNLKDDILALTRARDAIRLAWETVKAELAAAQDEIAALGGELPEVAVHARLYAATGGGAVTIPRFPTPMPVSKPGTEKIASAILEFPKAISAEQFKAAPPIAPPAGEGRPTDDHRALANVVMGVPPLLRSITQSLAKLATDPGDAALRDTLATDLSALNDHCAPMSGHPVQRVAAAMHSLGAHTEAADLGLPSIRSLQQGADLLGRLLDPAQLKRARSLEKPTALVVDDDPDMVATVTDALSKAGIATSSCCDPDQAMGQLSDKAFDLVLLDIGFPKANGIEMCARIREFEANKRTPIVFLTGTDSTETRAQSSLNGGNDFITKPFNTRELALKAGTWAFRNQFDVN
ncbi:MAG: response regulator, partial [Chthoniobacteraceae bacterium]